MLWLLKVGSNVSRVRPLSRKLYWCNNLKVEYLSVWVCKSSQSETKQRTQSDVQLIDWNRKVQKKIFARLLFCHPTINQRVMSWGGYHFVSRTTLPKDWKEKLLILYCLVGIIIAHKVGNNSIYAIVVFPFIRLQICFS